MPTGRWPSTSSWRRACGGRPSWSLVAPGYGPSGAAVGVLVGEIVAAVHARVRRRAGLVRRRLPRPRRPRLGGRRCAPTAMPGRGDRAPAGRARPRRRLVSLSMVAVLQNIDVLVVGRDNRRHSGAYAAVSVTSKAIVFGAIVSAATCCPRRPSDGAREGTPSDSWPWSSSCSPCRRSVLLGVALAAPEKCSQVVFHHEYTVGGRAGPARAGHDRAQRHRGADDVPAGRGPALGGGVLVAGALALTLAVAGGHTARPGPRPWWTLPSRRASWP